MTMTMMKTPLYNVYQTQAGAFTDYQNWELPERFSTSEEEYSAVRNATGVVDVSYRAMIRLHGPDRVDFLHQILSNDIKRLSPGAGCYAALLSVQGKVMGVMKALATEDAIWLETEPVTRAAVLDGLEKYKLTQQVHIEDVSAAFIKVLLQGPNATGLLQTLVHQELSLDEDLQHRECQLESRTIRVIWTSETGEGGYELIAPIALASRLWTRLMETGVPFGLLPIGFRAFNILRVEAGIPWYGVDVDDTNFPQEARMDDILDWTKGCYVGQEPVARIKFRGHVNRQLTGLKFAQGAEPESGNKIVQQGREIGHITTAVDSFYLNCPIALGYIRREYLEPGTEITVKTRQGLAAAEVAALPFYPYSHLAA